MAGWAAAISLGFLGVTGLRAEEPEKAKDKAPAPAPADVLFQFVGNYCLECHDSLSKKGDRDFESFELPLTSRESLVDARDILDALMLEEMPPKDADQPSEEDRFAALEALHGGIAASRGKLKDVSGRTVMRRLSNREYENTMEVLFGRSLATMGLTADFPKENTSENMDNIGDTLVTSGFLLDQYFQAANRLVELRLGKPETPAQDWIFKGHFLQPEELSGAHKKAFNYRYLCVYEQPDTDTRQGSYGYINDFIEGVPVSGLYDLEVLVQGMNRDTHYDPEIFKIDLSEPFQMAVVPGDYRKGHIHYPQKIEPVLGSTIVPDEQPEWRKFRVWLEKGQTPRFTFPNGPYESRASIITINQRYKDEFKDPPPKSGVDRTQILLEGDLPYLRISEIKIHGPVSEPNGGKEEVAVFGKDGFVAERALDQLRAFGERAYRRPLTDFDKQQIEKIYRKRVEQKATPRQAALDTVKMILCSPSFLYLAEATPEDQSKLGPYDLASRLSYALWAGPPDEALLAAAKSGALTDPAELKRQSQRLLKDPRSAGFVNAFLDSWLSLRDIGNQPPPRKSAPAYYAENLPASMKEEPRQMFRHLLETDGPATDFLDAGYSYVDKKLAKLYDLPEKNTLRLADGFQRVNFQGSQQRGGLLGMAGVLTVSANGVDTSPVTRGVWVMRNIMGMEPPPPPASVPKIESDVRGATTIRERLAKHTADQSCRDCHRKFDPLGFALESFDPIGRWRTHYPAPKGGAPAPKPAAKPKPEEAPQKPDWPKPMPKPEAAKDAGKSPKPKDETPKKADTPPAPKPANANKPKADLQPEKAEPGEESQADTGNQEFQSAAPAPVSTPSEPKPKPAEQKQPVPKPQKAEPKQKQPEPTPKEAEPKPKQPEPTPKEGAPKPNQPEPKPKEEKPKPEPKPVAQKSQGPVAPKVDPSGEFPSGDTYADFSEFREYLAEHRKDLFVRALIEKLLTYSSGRRLEPGDYYEIEDILKRVKEKEYGLQTLVTEVTSSEIFQSR